jgi:prefoldin subunit 5
MLQEAQDKLKELVEQYNATNQAIVDAQARQSDLKLAIAEQQSFIRGLESNKKPKKEK